MTMDATWFDHLDLTPALQRPELLAAPVRAALEGLLAAPGWAADSVLVTPIDAEVADTAAFGDRYHVPPEASANCVVAAGRRAGEQRWAAAVVLATTRADINGVVRRRMDVRKISFAPMDEATARTGMEYGGITPVGLPSGWPILVDAAVAAAGPVVIGSGIRASKLVVDGADVARLPGAETIDGLAQPAGR